MQGAGSKTELKNKKDVMPFQRGPHTKPPFTLGQIKKAIPPHCFRRSLLKSSSYVAIDVSVIVLLYYIATTYFQDLPHPYPYIAWPIYWFCTGCIGVGLWVLAHECGHHAFSDYQLVDDTVGYIIHTILLVPYFSFKLSHRRHHSNTGSIERDEVFVPRPKSQLPWYLQNLNSTPPGRVVYLFLTLTVGWPLYLAINASGRPYDRFASHYDPYGPIFSDRETALIYFSDAGILAMVYLLYKLAMVKGIVWVVNVYWMPYLIMNAINVAITYLHHTHPALPHYDSSEWDWLRGALVTVERDYGVFNTIFHHITDTHVVHHLFSTMPHYHAVEATKAIKPILGDYFRFDDTPFLPAIWRAATECLYVEQDESKKGVYWFQNKL